MQPTVNVPNTAVVMSLSYRLRNQSLLDDGYLKVLPTTGLELLVYES